MLPSGALRAWLCRCAIAARVTQTHLASDSTVCEWRGVCGGRWTKKCPGSCGTHRAFTHFALVALRAVRVRAALGSQHKCRR